MKVFVTRAIPESGLSLLRAEGYEVTVNPQDRVLTKEELIAALRAGSFDAVLSLLTDKVDEEVLSAAGEQCKIFANYAVGFDNIDLAAASRHNILVSNTPGVLSESVGEHAVALLLAITRRVVEGDRFMREGKYQGWAPMLLLGEELSGKTLGIVGLGAIGRKLARIAHGGLSMNIMYYDVKRAEDFETQEGAQYRESADDVFKEADVVSLHVPLLPATRHLADGRRLRLMKKTAYLINTSRGPVVDEAALAAVLREGLIAGAGLDVFEHEPKVNPELLSLQNVVLTPHIASATVEARDAMAKSAAQNVIAALKGEVPPNIVKGNL